MGFILIDRNQWKREEFFQHYVTEVPCSYSMSVKMEITALRRRGEKLYPAMLYAITTIVNRHEEFRTAFDAQGRLGVYDAMLPCYTVFHKETETFSNLWTEYTESYEAFCRAYEEDLEQYGDRQGLMGKPDVPPNNFPVSMVPWTSFEGFHLHVPKGNTYLLPIFTMGRYEERDGKWWLPLAIQVHHGVCDGFHVCRFLQELQELLQSQKL